MAKFNLEQYETVDSRIKRFMKDYEDGRITTELVSMDGEIGKTRWVVKASVFRYLDETTPSATGYAFEVDGTGMANQTSALENAESSARGRALQALGYTGAKSPSREEMEKVERATQVNWLEEAAKCKTKDELRFVWSKARAVNADAEVLQKLKEMADELPDS